MRKNFRMFQFNRILLVSMMFLSCSIIAQDKTMTWTSKSESAKSLANMGGAHFRNIEFQQAYEYFKQAVNLDPDFTVALVLISTLSRGESKKAYEERAVKSAANKTEGEKLFASTVAPGNTPESNRVIWEKLQKMFPDGKLIATFYLFSMATPAEQLTALEGYVKKYPDDAPFQNLMGYLCLQQKKDTPAAKKHFEEYIRLNPNGTNPYDSMGEFYFLTGDMVNSEKYYTLALEKYPFNSSSLDKLKEIAAAKEKNAPKDKSATKTTSGQ